jgi:hypothetical protein
MNILVDLKCFRVCLSHFRAIQTFGVGLVSAFSSEKFAAALELVDGLPASEPLKWESLEIITRLEEPEVGL